MRIVLAFLCCCVSSMIVMGQGRTTLTSANADCSGIVDLWPADTVFGPTTPPVSSGASLEISGDMTSLYAFELEHNTVWYRFKVPSDGQLTFDVIPVSQDDDYDFILYKFTGRNFCAEVASKTAKPLRTCISRNDPAEKSQTGLRNGATDEFVHSGPGAAYCKPLPVKKGEIYVLVLDNVYPNGKGHTLKLHYGQIPDTNIQQGVQQTTQIQASVPLDLKIVDKTTRLPVVANVQILAKNNRDTTAYNADSVSRFRLQIKRVTSFVVTTEANGFFGCVREFNSGGDTMPVNMIIELERIVAGKKVVFDDILFVGNEARFLMESMPTLKSLLKTMQQNPKLVIVVEGHVNCPEAWASCRERSMQNFNMRLSEERAKEVVDYLVENGIAAERMSYEGFGASRMLYPDARSEDKMKKNRRVEIVVVSNE